MTTKDEALKLALEALEPRPGMPNPEYESLTQCAITAIRETLAKQPPRHRHISYVCPQCHWTLDEQPAQQQEPKGVVIEGYEDRIIHWRDGCMPSVGTKLYTSPPAAQQQERVAVARVDDLERGGRVRALAMGLSLDAPLYTSLPASKPWVGLTASEHEKLRWQALEEDAGYTQLIKATEAKLKEKNQ